MESRDTTLEPDAPPDAPKAAVARIPDVPPVALPVPRAAPSAGSRQARPDPARTTPTERRRPRPIVELLLVMALFGVYKAGRVIAAQHIGAAFDNADDVWRLERALWIPSELSVQHLLMHSTAMVRLANAFYASVHFPATAAFLLWMYLRRPDYYLWARRALVGLTASALALHLLVPLAPPRMLPGLGFVDTAALVGPAVYGEPGPGSIADQYAAMPSLHVGWAVMVAIGLIVATRSRWRWLWLIHPIVTTLVVVSTGNHFWFDGVLACLLLGLSLLCLDGSFPRRTVAGGMVATATANGGKAGGTADRGTATGGPGDGGTADGGPVDGGTADPPEPIGRGGSTEWSADAVPSEADATR